MLISFEDDPIGKCCESFFFHHDTFDQKSYLHLVFVLSMDSVHELFALANY